MPRHMEVALCGLGLLLLSPLLLVVALAIRLSSPGPVVYRQRRLGLHGRRFELIKFRSMTHRPSDGGPKVTARGDARVTGVGRILRATKLDEMPQLWNVIRGDMSLVGPRPEVPDYVCHYPHLFDLVLQQRPGITDVCTLHLRDEERLLGEVDEPERFYVETLLPRKLAASIREGWRRTFWRDLRVLIATVLPGHQRLPGLEGLAPAPDFRPLADLYALPTTAPRAASAAVAGGEDREPVRIEHTA